MSTDQPFGGGDGPHVRDGVDSGDDVGGGIRTDAGRK
jgi:hypothetical protein